MTKKRTNIALGGGARHAEFIASAHFRWPSWRSFHWIFGGPRGSATEFNTTRLGTECRPGADRVDRVDRATSPAAPAAATELEEVVVVGTRAAQRTSIDRKKNAATAMDSISAEDVGKFPDQNVNEAISRVAGVALDRGDNGEGQGISIRGNGMEATRVDIDGMSVLNTNGALSGWHRRRHRWPRGRSARIAGRHHQEHRRHQRHHGSHDGRLAGRVGAYRNANRSRVRQTFPAVLHRRPAEFRHRLS